MFNVSIEDDDHKETLKTILSKITLSQNFILALFVNDCMAYNNK